MNNICLVMPLSVSDFVDVDVTLDAQPKATAPQLGILALAAAIRQRGWNPLLINLNELFVDFIAKSRMSSLAEAKFGALIERVLSSPREVSQSSFLEFVCDEIAKQQFDVLGIGTICSSYPLSLRIAERVKLSHPGLPIVFGGPQASVVDVQTLETFDSVDYVLRGEADTSLPQLLDALAGGYSALEGVAGLTFRHYASIQRNPAPPLIELDELPLPAYDLDPYTRDRRSVSLELGRGCPFACTFCSTNDFFRRNFRLKSTKKLLEEMEYLEQTYGIRHFDLVHDMYTVNRRKVVEFCEALIAAGHDFKWGCSARTDCVDERLLGLMADAGCSGIFFGIETGSARLQQVIKKKLDLDEATAHIAAADRHAISTAVALIIGFPDETREDLRDSIHYYIEASRFDHAKPQMSLLAPLAETPIETEYRDHLMFDDIFSSMSYQGWQWNEGDIELVKAHPRIFSNFYAVPTRWVSRPYLSELHDVVAHLTRRARWLTLGLVRDSGDFLAIFDRWLAWRPLESIASGEQHFAPYYARENFLSDFMDFVEKVYLPEMSRNAPAIRALVANERLILSFGSCAEEQSQAVKDKPPCDAAKGSVELTFDTVPRPTSGVRLARLDVDYDELISCLRDQSSLDTLVERPTTVFYKISKDGNVEIRQLAPLSCALLNLCDGKKAVRELIASEDWRANLRGESSPEQYTFVGLKQLYEESLLAV
jgi:radical SAM superfamily enzyme YgiQ (UPF0313 family)